jgi:hypothetical protein
MDRLHEILGLFFMTPKTGRGHFRSALKGTLDLVGMPLSKRPAGKKYECYYKTPDNQSFHKPLLADIVILYVDYSET